MIVLSGADLVLPNGIQPDGTLVIDGARIVEIGGAGARGALGAAEVVDLRNHIVVPGFVDVHVHGLEGLDTLDGADAIAAIAGRLPRFGVTGFCPTTVACSPEALGEVLRSVAALRNTGRPGPDEAPPAPITRARVLPAHLESNFINPDYKGAQPEGCLRSPVGATDTTHPEERGATGFDGRDIVAEIDKAGDSVGIVTLAPELDGAMDLIRYLVSRGRRVSLGHSGATLEEARAAVAAGARHATHLFNRMPSLSHREPGLVGAILTSDDVAAEIICDGVHVHRAMVRMAVATKGPRRMMAITDGVAAAGLPDGSPASLGGRPIRVRRSAAYLEDGTLAGSVATMDRVFRFLVHDVGLALHDAAQMCAGTPASELGLKDIGAIAIGAFADLVILDRNLTVKRTYVAGRLVYDRH
jgi:N-acetylglucosamine-6-phosphate deacetylase